MLEQVCKNVIGNSFQSTVEDGKVHIVVPCGSELTVFDFGKLVKRLERALNMQATISGTVTLEGQVEVTLSFTEVEKTRQVSVEEGEKVAPKKRVAKKTQIDQQEVVSEELEPKE